MLNFLAIKVVWLDFFEKAANSGGFEREGMRAGVEKDLAVDCLENEVKAEEFWLLNLLLLCVEMEEKRSLLLCGLAQKTGTRFIILS